MGLRHDKQPVAFNGQFWLLFAMNLAYERA
jgi:hypothetical protein